MLGAAHSMANPLTAHFDVPHGQAVATALPLVVSYNAAEDESLDRYADLARAAGLVAASASRDEACRALLENNREICNRLFPEPRGSIAPGQLADVAVRDYVPFTPLDAANFQGHLLFGLAFAGAHTTIARGRVVVEEGRLPDLDEEAIRARCVERGLEVWSRIE